MTDEQSTHNVTRRRILQGTGIVGVGSLAGCFNSASAPDSGNGSGGGGGGNGSGGGGNGSGGNGGGGGGNGSSGGGGGSNSKLKLAQVKSPIEFDPIVLNDVPSDQVAGLVFDSLYDWDEAGSEIVPKIAASKPEVENGGQRYVIELNGDAKFHNGNPVTAEDVAYSFTAPVKEETENSADYNMIDTAETVDDKTVQFDLKYPFGAFESYLTGYIVPKSVREKDKKAFNTNNPVGAGPFTFEGWREGDYTRVKRWDDYWDDPTPNLSGVEFIPVEEGTTRITTLRSGENDIVEEIPPKSWSTVKNMGDSSINATAAVGYYYLSFNCKNGPTADPKVREAIDYTFSMDQAVSNFVEPTGVRQYSPLPKVLIDDWDFPIEKWKKIPHDKDIDQAKSMLDDSDDVPDNWNATIIVPPDDKREQIGTSVANGLKEAGYNATVQRLDWGAFLEKYVSGDPNDYNMYTLGWSGSPDPDSFMYFLFAQSQAGLGQGHFYENEEVNSAILDARKSTEQSERKRLYQQAITTILEDRVNIPAYNLKNSFGVKGYVNDFTAHPVTSFSIVSEYNNVSLDN